MFKEARSSKSAAKAEKIHVPKFHKPIKLLPSQGKLYPKNLELFFRPYTFGEVKTINQQSKTNFTSKTTVEQILSGVEANLPDFDLKNLTLQDALFIGFLRKRSTFLKQDKVLIHKQCTHCEKVVDFLLEENKSLEFKDLAAPQLPIYTEINGIELSFQPLTVNNYFQYLDFITDQIDKMEDFYTDIASMAVQCNNKDFQEAYDLIFSSSYEEAEKLEEVSKLLDHELKPVELACPSCKTVNTIKLDEVDLLVLPFRGELPKPATDGIYFVKRT